MIGVLVAPLSDKYGRKPVIFADIVFGIVGFIGFYIIKTYAAYFTFVLIISITGSLNT
jgi:MFS family permease